MPADPGASFVAQVPTAPGSSPHAPQLLPPSSGQQITPQGFISATDCVQWANGLSAAIVGYPHTCSTGAEPHSIDSQALLDLYKSHGIGVAAQLRGSWAFILVDPSESRVLLATDRIGRIPVYFAMTQEGLIAGTDLPVLRQLSTEAKLSDQSLYNYVYFHMIPAPGSAWVGLHKLRAGEQLELHGAGKTFRRYWTPRFTEHEADRHKQHQALRSRLKDAVQRCRPTQGKVGAFLSGGLDSSTVAGMLSELQEGCDAYAIGFDAEGYDEMAYARITAEHFGIRLHEYYVTPDDVVSALPVIATGFEEPFGNSSALPAYFCARMAAADGITTLLAGDGGDELFAGNERYAKQKVFEPYQRLPAWLRGNLMEPLLNILPAALPLVRKARSYITQAKLPLPDRLQYYSFLEQINPGEVFSTSLLQRVDTAEPLTLLRATYQTPDGASELNRMLFLDWQITLADNDLRKVSQACRMAGVTVRYPMLDDDLVELSTSLPSTWKLPGDQLRHFYKQALTGWLPDATINKSKHGFGLPFGVWMKSHKPLQELAYEHILALKQRRIFRDDFLEQAISSHRDGHASYFGELIWVLTALELWLTKHKPDFRHD